MLYDVIFNHFLFAKPLFIGLFFNFFDIKKGLSALSCLATPVSLLPSALRSLLCFETNARIFPYFLFLFAHLARLNSLLKNLSASASIAFSSQSRYLSTCFSIFGIKKETSRSQCGSSHPFALPGNVLL